MNLGAYAHTRDNGYKNALILVKRDVGSRASYQGNYLRSAALRAFVAVFTTLEIATSALNVLKGTNNDIVCQFDLHYISSNDDCFLDDCLAQRPVPAVCIEPFSQTE